MTGASTDVAEAVEIHESSMNGDVMEMKQVTSVPLQAYADIEFAPGGLHLMLVNLKKELKIGEEIEISLHFKNSKDIRLRVAVRDTPAPEEDE